MPSTEAPEKIGAETLGRHQGGTFAGQLMKNHTYKTTVHWTGNSGMGTRNYTSYERSHTISVQGKAVIKASSDPAFRGDQTLYNPEELLVASLSSCHMLWYLHLCSAAGIIVLEYSDEATGIMEETDNGSGFFTGVTLHPAVVVSHQSMVEQANALHREANNRCFVANSCNFPVYHRPTCRSEDGTF